MGKENIPGRIEAAPLTTREELIEATLGPGQPKAMEWVDLADAGPYVDETTVPIYSSPDGSTPIYVESETARQWIDKRLSGLPRIGDSRPEVDP